MLNWIGEGMWFSRTELKHMSDENSVSDCLGNFMFPVTDLTKMIINKNVGPNPSSPKLSLESDHGSSLVGLERNVLELNFHRWASVELQSQNSFSRTLGCFGVLNFGHQLVIDEVL